MVVRLSEEQKGNGRLALRKRTGLTRSDGSVSTPRGPERRLGRHVHRAIVIWQNEERGVSKGKVLMNQRKRTGDQVLDSIC